MKIYRTEESKPTFLYKFSRRIIIIIIINEYFYRMFCQLYTKNVNTVIN